MKQILVAVALVMVGLVPGVSQAVPLTFFDDFNTETLELNHGTFPQTNFTQWTVFDGAVDLIGASGFFDIAPDALHGQYVDLDGTTNDAGVMSSAAFSLLAATSYELTFDLAGSQRGDDTNTMTNYGIDTIVDTSALADISGALLSRDSADPFSTVTLSFTTVAAIPVARIVFGQVGGDNIGLLLDNVKLQAVQAVPEPASLMLLGAGLAAIGIWRRKAGKG